MVVKVVVDARPSRALALRLCWHAPEVAPVIIRPEQNYIIGDPHALLVVALHLFVEAP